MYKNQLKHKNKKQQQRPANLSSKIASATTALLDSILKVIQKKFLIVIKHSTHAYVYGGNVHSCTKIFNMLNIRHRWHE